MFCIPHSKFHEEGVTLIEIIIVVAIIVIFSAILIADFPSIERGFYLSQAASTLAEDLRKAENLSLSGSYISNSQGDNILISGYGVYLTYGTDAPPPAAPYLVDSQHYLLYADSCFNANDTPPLSDFQYTPALTSWCIGGDTSVDGVDLSKINSDVEIEGINGVIGDWTSIDFTPPDPKVTIANLAPDTNEIGIILGLKSNPSETEEVDVNTAGFINVKQ